MIDTCDLSWVFHVFFCLFLLYTGILQTPTNYFFFIVERRRITLENSTNKNNNKDNDDDDDNNNNNHRTKLRVEE